MKKWLLLFLVFSVSSVWAFERRPILLEITPEAAFITERFSFKAGEISKAKVGLPGEIKTEDLLIKDLPEGCTVSFVFEGEDHPTGQIWKEMDTLLREKARLEEKLKVLSTEEAWIREGGKFWLEKGGFKDLSALSARLQKVLSERSAVKRRISAFEREIREKEEALSTEEFFLFPSPILLQGLTFFLRLRLALSCEA